MNDNNEENKSFKVNDRRRFDYAGNEKSSNSTSVEVEPKESSLSSEEQGFTIQESNEEYQINFPSFIASLATQALILMGELPAPEGLEAPHDLEAAKQTIDIIAMLQEKTAGNLDPDEANFLKEMLHNLRLSYLKHQ